MAKERATAVPDEQIVAALITHNSIQAAAEACSVSPRLVYARMGRSEFKALYSAARADLIRAAVMDMAARLTEATGTIYSIMTDTAAPPATRLTAARIMLDNAARFMDRLAVADTLTGTYQGGL